MPWSQEHTGVALLQICWFGKIPQTKYKDDWCDDKFKDTKFEEDWYTTMTSQAPHDTPCGGGKAVSVNFKYSNREASLNESTSKH